ncbi:helix-turn-helix domain-containing protein [Alkalihalobacterium bogoriense]|uniref:helix-turn-helix domain-containing protein n=1 Tax=Alkalihalobacterium bogoriense TaxID=246272 RepID=UPI00047D45C0|nr:helix-turn-helix transcriptional regulator [Alkalihalobacterium bogoriense]
MENTFGQILKRERNKQGLSLVKLSSKINNAINASYINRLETGDQQNPGFTVVCMLCSALNIDMREVFRAFNYESLITNYNKEAEFSIEELIRLHKVKVPMENEILSKEEQEMIINIIQTAFRIAKSDVRLEDLSPLLHEIQQLHDIQKRYVDTVEVAFQSKTFIFNITAILEQSDLSREEVIEALKEQMEYKGSKLLDVRDELIVLQIKEEVWLAKKVDCEITFISNYVDPVSL